MVGDWKQVLATGKPAISKSGASSRHHRPSQSCSDGRLLWIFKIKEKFILQGNESTLQLTQKNYRSARICTVRCDERDDSRAKKPLSEGKIQRMPKKTTGNFRLSSGTPWSSQGRDSDTCRLFPCHALKADTELGVPQLEIICNPLTNSGTQRSSTKRTDYTPASQNESRRSVICFSDWL